MTGIQLVLKKIHCSEIAWGVLGIFAFIVYQLLKEDDYNKTHLALFQVSKKVARFQYCSGTLIAHTPRINSCICNWNKLDNKDFQE